jgi:NAD(P)-dependent dehydrogenase (short-subunit alcohol dehydrogenase family)
MTRLKNKVCVITGAAGGIGAASARLFVREGARVMLVDRDLAALEALARELGDSAALCVADVASAEDSQRYVQATVARFGRIDVLFANAGIEGKVAPIAELTPEQFDQVQAVNVRGVFLGVKYAIPALAKQGGSIVITSSVAGLQGAANLAAYVTSKHALLGLMRTAAVELAPQGIRVNTIHPGPIDNRMMHGIEGQLAPGHEVSVKEGFEGQVPLRRYGTNEEVAQLALFLASSDSSYCTGSTFLVDGGYTAH